MSLLVSVAIVVLGVLALNGLLVALRRRRREEAASLGLGVTPRRLARDLPTRAFVDRDVAGGPQARGINHGPANIVLAPDRFIVATWQGRILEISPELPGTARCAGPRRLVVEGQHPSGRAQVRAEILVDEAEAWARDICAINPPPVHGA